MSWRNRLLIVFFAFFCQLFAFAGQTFFLCSAASGSVYGPFEKKPGTIISIHGRDWAIIASEPGKIIFESFPDRNSFFGPYDFVENRIVRLGASAFTIVDISEETSDGDSGGTADVKFPVDADGGIDDNEEAFIEDVPVRWERTPVLNVIPVQSENAEDMSAFFITVPSRNSVSMFYDPVYESRYDWSIGGFRGNHNSSLERMRIGFSGSYGNWFGEVSYAFSGKTSKNIVPDGSILSNLGLDNGSGFHLTGGYEQRLKIDEFWNASLGAVLAYSAEDYDLKARAFTLLDESGDVVSFDLMEDQTAALEDVPDFSYGYKDSKASLSFNETVFTVYGGIDRTDGQSWSVGVYGLITVYSDADVDGSIAVSDGVFDLSSDRSHPLTLVFSGWYAPNENFYVTGGFSFGSDTFVRIGIGRFL